MTNPRIYLIRMLLFILVVALLAGAFAPQVSNAFLSSVGLNGLIFAILLFGIVYICRQVFQLTREVAWIETFRTGRPGVSTQTTCTRAESAAAAFQASCGSPKERPARPASVTTAAKQSFGRSSREAARSITARTGVYPAPMTS